MFFKCVNGKCQLIVAIMSVTLFLRGQVASAAVEYMYESPLTVTETITDIGGGDYKYEYSFTNTDSSPIWHFGIFTSFYPRDNSFSTFDEYPDWYAKANPTSIVTPEYDGSNLHPDIIRIIFVTPMPWENFNDGIDPGQSVSGFSFESYRLDRSPKYYYYETLASGYAYENGGMVAAVGQTVPEPTTLLLLGCGAVGWLRRSSAIHHDILD